jgi:Mg2+-importing ATPase
MDLQTDIKRGLTEEFVRAHPPKKSRSGTSTTKLVFVTLKNQVMSIFFLLLLASAILSYLLGEHVDSAIFLGINLLNVLIGFIQEFRASKASQALEKMIAHNATVLRDGKLKEVLSTEVIEGDIIMLSSGDVLVADVLVRIANDSFIDESVRTGESAPLLIRDGQTLFAGTSIVSGHVVGQVVAVGANNSLMKYATKLKDVKKHDSFGKFVSKISLYILLTTIISLAVIAYFSVFVTAKYTLAAFALFSIAMLVGVVPESLPLIITLMLTREALTLSKENVIIKKLSALQLLGSIKYLLTDKTGTITENKIRMADIVDISDLEETATRIAFSEYERTPMDNVFDQATRERFSLASITGEPIESVRTLDKPEVTPYMNLTGYVRYDFPNISVIRGQFRKIADLCNYRSSDLDNAYVGYELQGLRVIAIASSTDESRKTFALNGLLVFEDPLKPDARHSYLAAEGLGISVKVITGDSPLVATYIAEKLDSNLSGKNVCALDAIPVSRLSEGDILNNKVYARCQSEQKLELINRHSVHGAVGFLGEGINDALALKSADVSIVVNNASDVAIQSADILLLEKSLNPIVKAIQMSRRVYSHISTYLLCTLTGNIGTLFSLSAVALLWKDLPMLPVQILLNNLLTDVPLIMLITDKLSKDEYSKPVDHKPGTLFRTIVVFGLISTFFDLMYFGLFHSFQLETVRTGWFIMSVLAELVLVLSLRTHLSAWKGKRISMKLAFALAGSGILAIALPFIPFLSSAFSLVPLSAIQLGIIFAVIVVYFLTNEAMKRFGGKLGSVSQSIGMPVNEIA